MCMEALFPSVCVYVCVLVNPSAKVVKFFVTANVKKKKKKAHIKMHLSLASASCLVHSEGESKSELKGETGHQFSSSLFSRCKD